MNFFFSFEHQNFGFFKHKFSTKKNLKNVLVDKLPEIFVRIRDVVEERVECEDEHLAGGQLVVGPRRQVGNQNLKLRSQRARQTDGGFVRAVFVQS